MQVTVADVVIDRAARGLDRPLSYRVPDALGAVEPGFRVEVPLGRGRATGLVLRVSPQEDRPELKDVGRRVDGFPLLPRDLVALAEWMHETYVCLWSQVVRVMVPAPVRRMPVPPPPALYPGDQQPTRAGRLRRLAEVVAAQPGIAADEAMTAAAVEAAVVSQAVARGYVRRGPAPLPPLPASRVALTPAQVSAVEAVEQAAATGGSVLVEGVTGSGKTEVYLDVIARVLARGRQAIVLVPEIALTPQMQARFEARFPGRVAVFHSAMADGDRVRAWHAVRTGAASVVLGARSAVFAPCPALGCIILDEEHESTYKQDEQPRYHAREVAEARCRATGAVLVLGSATPALETAYAARTGRRGWVRLPARATPHPLPTVTVVDLREELKAGNRSMFSRQLARAVTETLEAKDQVILLMNRRGYATAVVCRDCGHALRCPACAVSLTVHQAEQAVVCHYCSFRQPLPTACPACGSPRIRQFGTGTEQVAEEVARRWPKARVARADHDALRQRGSHERLFHAMAERRIDVLVGTQMVAKGLDFPGVTLVGVVAADLTLTLPDFRAAERTYALLTQVAGRAGRGSRPGRVVIQTYNPDHYSITAAAAQDYDRFYQDEIAYRQALSYPPFGHLALLEAQDADPEAAEAMARAAAAAVARPPWTVLGPAPAPIARLRGRYRWHVLVKGPLSARIRDAAALALEAAPRLSVTIDPYFLM